MSAGLGLESLFGSSLSLEKSPPPRWEKVKLVSEFVRPDLELSDATIDFGHVPVGQVKRITMKSQTQLR